MLFFLCKDSAKALNAQLVWNFCGLCGLFGGAVNVRRGGAELIWWLFVQCVAGESKFDYFCKRKSKIMNKVSENPFKNRTDGDVPLMVVTALFVTLYLVSNLMAVKIISIGGFFYFDAGTITFPFAYMLGDVLTEIWGFRTARRIIWLTFLCNVIMVVCTQVGVWLPSPDYLEGTAAAYDAIFSYVPRIVIGSLVGFLMGEISNAWFMERLKAKTRGRFLWVRTIGSSMLGYLLDTLPFVLIAFWGTVTVRDLLMMIVFQYSMKLSIEVVFGTPLAYAVILWLKRGILKSRHNG